MFDLFIDSVSMTALLLCSCSCESQSGRVDRPSRIELRQGENRKVRVGVDEGGTRVGQRLDLGQTSEVGVKRMFSVRSVAEPGVAWARAGFIWRVKSKERNRCGKAMLGRLPTNSND